MHTNIQNHLYIACTKASTIQHFLWNALSGRLSLQKSLHIQGRPQPLCVSPDHSLLYAGIRDDNALGVFRILPTDGALSDGATFPAPFVPTYLSTSPDQKHLFWASYSGNALAVFELDEEGKPMQLAQSINELPKAHCAIAHPSGKFLFVPMLGRDAIGVFQHALSHPPLSALPALHYEATQGSGPRHLIFSHQGKKAFCLHELDGTISAFEVDDQTGVLTPYQRISLLPKNLEGAPWAAEIQITKDERFLYATERSSSTIACFGVDRHGKLTLLSHQMAPTQPRGMVISPSGTHVFCTGQIACELWVYEINQATGALSLKDQHPTEKDPIGMAVW